MVSAGLAAGGAACREGDHGSRETVTVFAASALTESFTELSRRFEAAHPGFRAVLNFGASSSLARAVVDGAPADVLATADRPALDPVVGAGLAAPPHTFASNRLAILVETGNPGAITSLADLARPDVTFVRCADQVPCGRLASEALARAGVAVRARSLEADVKGVVAKVTSGEADAGLVYATDARAARGRAQGVLLPPEHDVEIDHAIAVLTSAPNPAGARRFVEFVLSSAGRTILLAAGFQLP